MKRWVSVAAVATLVIGLAVVWWSMRNSTGRDGSERSSDTIAVSAAEFKALQQQVEALKGRANSPPINYYVAGTDAASAAVSQSGDDRTREQLEEDGRNRQRETVASLERRFANEPVDGAWSRNARREIEDAIR